MTSPSLTALFPDSADSGQQAVDSTAFQPAQVEQLYMAHCERLEKFLSGRTRSKDLVEVILQDIYLKLMAIPDLSVIKNPSAYLNRLANNLLVDHYRQQELYQRWFTEHPLEDIDCTEPVPSLPEQLHYDQLLDAYQQALNELPDYVQEIVRLFHIEGLTHQEIAKKLGKSTSWIEKSIARALLHCRQKIDDIEY
jgi:RNA polymerase sigma-70 factor (ECF subfamily)